MDQTIPSDNWRDPYRTCETTKDCYHIRNGSLGMGVLLSELEKGDGPYPAVTPDLVAILRYRVD